MATNLAPTWPHLTKREKDLLLRALDYHRDWRSPKTTLDTLVLVSAMEAGSAVYNYTGHLMNNGRIRNHKKPDPEIRELVRLRRKIIRNA